MGKLQNTAEEVKILQVNLEDMKPALEVAAKDADVMIKQIAADTVSNKGYNVDLIFDLNIMPDNS